MFIAFQFQLQSVQDMMKKTTERHQRCRELGVTQQPEIYIVENPRTYYVKSECITYKLPTLLKAVDTNFKLMTVLNLQYSGETHGIYSFIQRYFYDITTKYDKMSPSVLQLICSLEQ